MTFEQRFWKHVLLLDDSPESCWIWVGAIRDDGYGRFFMDSGRREIRAHWAAWELKTGNPVPEGWTLESTCGNPQCVRHWQIGRRRKAVLMPTARLSSGRAYA
jgi:hypothetical protein